MATCHDASPLASSRLRRELAASWCRGLGLALEQCQLPTLEPARGPAEVPDSAFKMFMAGAFLALTAEVPHLIPREIPFIIIYAAVALRSRSFLASLPLIRRRVKLSL